MDTRSFSSSPASEEAPWTSPVPRPVLVNIMVALLLTAFLEALDNLIVTPALPRPASSLHGLDRYTRVVTAYLLAATAAVPLAGKLSDQFGRKGFLLGGIIIFLLGSGLAGTSQTMDQLIICVNKRAREPGDSLALQHSSNQHKLKFYLRPPRSLATVVTPFTFSSLVKIRWSWFRSSISSVVFTIAVLLFTRLPIESRLAP
jgi:hypothetical protein